MNKTGLTINEVKSKLKSKGIEDETLIAAIAFVIDENNKKLTSNATDNFFTDIERGMKKRGR